MTQESNKKRVEFDWDEITGKNRPPITVEEYEATHAKPVDLPEAFRRIAHNRETLSPQGVVSRHHRPAALRRHVAQELGANMDIFPRNRHEARERAKEILQDYTGSDLTTFSAAYTQAAQESTFFVRRADTFADGSGPGVNVYRYENVLGRHTLIGCLTIEVAEWLYGALPVSPSLPEGVRIQD